MIALWLAVICFSISAFLTRRLLSPTSGFTVLDHPNERSLHANPTPSGGGLSIVVATFVGGVVVAIFHDGASPLGWIALAAVLIFTVSFVDDRTPLHPAHRLGVHLLAAGVLMFGGLIPQTFSLPGWVWYWPELAGAIFAILYIVWLINLYNFMDGIDSIAVSETIRIAGGALTLSAIYDDSVNLLSTVLTAAQKIETTSQRNSS